MKIRVHSKRSGFRRAGFTFGRQSVELTDEDLGKTAAERRQRLSMLRDEPMLVVEDLAEEDAKQDAEAGGKKPAQATGKKSQAKTGNGDGN